VANRPAACSHSRRFPVARTGRLRDNAHVHDLEKEPTELTKQVRRAPEEGTWPSIVAALAAIAAASVAAGAVGLLAQPLLAALTLLGLGVAVLAKRPLRDRTRNRATLLLLLLACPLALGMVALSCPTAAVMAAAVVLAALALTSAGRNRDMLCAASAAIAVLGLYRFAITSVPWLWLAADAVARSLGNVAGAITGRALWLGPTFAGLDMLVLTTAFWCIYLPYTRPPRTARAIYGILAILAGHLAYLVALSYVPDLLQGLPQPAGDAGWSWLGLLHKAVPWNVPAVGAAIHLVVVAAMLRWSARTETVANRGGNLDAATVAAEPRRVRFGVATLALAAAAVLPVIATLYPGPARLAGKKIVFYEKGFLNWLKPEHGSYGRLSSGMYGMLPVFLESLGAEPLISADLSDADLEGAEALVLIFPDERWEEGQLERIEAFVRQGGSLLVMGEHTTRNDDGGNRFNEVLSGTDMTVRFDSATFAVGGWLHSYETLGHPTTAGFDDDRNQFGAVIGASVRARWPARPLLVGRWGWTDLGDEASDRAMMGNGRYDPGEKLGDLVLAAEQPLGKGRIVTFGDTSGLTNAINVSSHAFNARLFAYLAGDAPRAHPAWRQALALGTGLFLVLLVGRRPGPWKILLVAGGLTASLTLCIETTDRGLTSLPDGRRAAPNNLAYIDAFHLEACSSESWRPDGLGGLTLTLMRNGYLTLALTEWTPERLNRAALLVSVAPARTFSPRDIETVRAFVENGGTFIITVGRERHAASAPLLNALGFRVGYAEDESIEPLPMGHFKSPYLEANGKRVYVRFHAAWPVTCTDPNASVIANGKENRPVIVRRRLGAGDVVLIGDTGFAMNKNLEQENGEAFEGLRENADFWRWLLTMLRDDEMWIPPALRSEPPREVGS